MTESKTLANFELKDEGDGAFSATFASFNVVDLDGDVTLPGAFRSGAKTVVGAFNHSSQRGDALPVGIATLRSDSRRAWAEGEFFDTPAGRTYRTTLKALGPLAEWSYSYKVDDQSVEYADLRAWPGAKRILRGVTVYEVSPVLRGAGIGTRTDYVKGAELVEIDDELAAFLDKARDNELGAIYRRTLLERMRFGPLTTDELAWLLD